MREQLAEFDGVLVWVNPIHEGRNRAKLDALLREVASRGIWVSAHPDVILKMGTKEVLYRTRMMGWGCEKALYQTPEEEASYRALLTVVPFPSGTGGRQEAQQSRQRGPSLDVPRHPRTIPAEECVPHR